MVEGPPRVVLCLPTSAPAGKKKKGGASAVAHAVANARAARCHAYIGGFSLYASDAGIHWVLAAEGALGACACIGAGATGM